MNVIRNKKTGVKVVYTHAEKNTRSNDKEVMETWGKTWRPVTKSRKRRSSKLRFVQTDKGKLEIVN